jgi:hypothetical protein
VDLRPPQRLVGVDVADTGHQRLVEQLTLDARLPPADPAHEPVVVELGVQRVAGDVRDLGRQLGAALRHQQPAEHALVGEPQLTAREPVSAEREPHPQVPVVRGADRLEPIEGGGFRRVPKSAGDVARLEADEAIADALPV